MDTLFVRPTVDPHTCVVCRRKLSLDGVIDIAPHGPEGATGPPKRPAAYEVRVRCGGCGHVCGVVFPVPTVRPDEVPGPLIRWLIQCGQLGRAGDTDRESLRVFSSIHSFWGRVCHIVERQEKKRQAEQVKEGVVKHEQP
ncbi:MAG: hypothetical protein AAF797_08440 [Planctomycetota bacterium]